MKKLRYGITGFGRFAEKAIAPAIINSANSTLVAIQNRSLEKARRYADALGLAHAFASVNEMVHHPEVDAIVIVSANAAHCWEAMLAAEAGKHVLCEKPMAMNEEECRKMIDACAANNVVLMVGHMLRLSPLVQRMKHAVQSGELGTVLRINADFIYDARLSTRTWIVDPAVAGGGPTFDVGVHCLDTIRFILDAEVQSVQGILMPPPSDMSTELVSQLLLRFSREVMATIFTSYKSPLRESRIEILGTEARVSAIDFTIGGRKADLRIERRSPSGTPATIIEQIDVPNLYVEEINHFSDSVLNGTPPLLSGENGLLNQRTLDTALRLHER